MKMNLNMAQSFSTTRKTIVKKAVSKLQGFFCFAVELFHSTVNKDTSFHRKCSIFIHVLERVNEFLSLNALFKFSSNKDDVA